VARQSVGAHEWGGSKWLLSLSGLPELLGEKREPWSHETFDNQEVDLRVQLEGSRHIARTKIEERNFKDHRLIEPEREIGRNGGGRDGEGIGRGTLH